LDEFVQQLANGVTKGSYYALIALGYTMVYGIIQLINFAHGEVYMLGAFIGLWTFNLGASTFGWSGTSLAALVVVLLMATLLTPVVGVSLERFAYRPLRHAPRLAPLITALGASFALQQLVAVFYSRGQLAFPDLFPNTSFQIAGANIQVLWVFMVTLALLLTFTLTAFIRTTRLGHLNSIGSTHSPGTLTSSSAFMEVSLLTWLHGLYETIGQFSIASVSGELIAMTPTGEC